MYFHLKKELLFLLPQTVFKKKHIVKYIHIVIYPILNLKSVNINLFYNSYI